MPSLKQLKVAILAEDGFEQSGARGGGDSLAHAKNKAAAQLVYTARGVKHFITVLTARALCRSRAKHPRAERAHDSAKPAAVCAQGALLQPLAARHCAARFRRSLSCAAC